MTLALLAVFAATLGLPVSVEASRPPAATPVPQKLREHIPYLSTRPMLLLAKAIGMSTVAG